ncbi:MAG: hypothetical protein ACFE9Z_13165 [Promethearchaeota archaeon]
MTDSNNKEPPRPEGIPLNTKAPQIDTTDIYDNPLILNEILEKYDGILIDFFRGNW